MDVLIPVSAGHLIDQITILRIKMAHITDPQRRENVCRELDALSRIRAKLPELVAPAILQLEEQLTKVNQDLWYVEDLLRAMEAGHDFGDRFTTAARSVYLTNDRRSVLKREIDRLTGSSIREEKSFTANTGT